MKKIIAFILIAAVLVCLFAGCRSDAEPETEGETATSAETAATTEAPTDTPSADYNAWHVALLTEDENTVYNQIVLEAGKAWCEARGIDFNYYGPTEITSASLVNMIDRAVADGYNTLIMAGWTLVDAIKETAAVYPDVYFILLDVYTTGFGRSYVMPENVCTATYQEHLLGFLAGYAAVKLGYRHLGFMGTKDTQPVVRYGYGFIQGANTAALELGVEREIAIDYAYANTLTGDPAVKAYAEAWYQIKGVEVCFACGGIETSVYEAAQKVTGAKVIGADTDMAVLDDVYGEGITISSAVKNYERTVQDILSDLIENDRWSLHAGQSDPLGLVSADDLDANYVRLAPTTRFADGKFSEEDYAALVTALLAGDYVVSDDLRRHPQVDIAVNYLGNVK